MYFFFVSSTQVIASLSRETFLLLLNSIYTNKLIVLLFLCFISNLDRPDYRSIGRRRGAILGTFNLSVNTATSCHNKAWLPNKIEREEKRGTESRISIALQWRLPVEPYIHDRHTRSYKPMCGRLRISFSLYLKILCSYLSYSLQQWEVM